MNSNHAQTESYRQGFHGPYVFTFTRSGIPSASSFDVSFFDNLGLTGYTAASGRGYVKGTASGVSSSFPIVVHWYNSNYQAVSDLSVPNIDSENLKEQPPGPTEEGLVYSGTVVIAFSQAISSRMLTGKCCSGPTRPLPAPSPPRHWWQAHTP